MRRRRRIQDEDPLLDVKFEHHHREPPIRELCLGGPTSSSGIVTKTASSSMRNTTRFPSSKSLLVSSVDPMEIISSKKALSSWMRRRMQFGGWNFWFVVAATALLTMTCPVNAAAAFVPTRASCQRRKEPQNLSLDNHKNSILISSFSAAFSAEKRTTTSVIVQVASANRPSTEAASAEEDLQSLTVQALKQKIKDGPPPAPRGLLSTLKRKQDMIEYLLEQQQQERHPEDPPPPQPSQPTVSSTSTAEPASTTISTNDKVEEIKDHHDDSIHHNHHPQSNPKKGPLKMPPMINNHHQEEDVQENQKTPREEEEDASTTAPSDNNDETIKLSRRDQLFEQVFERYPPLRDTYVDLNTNINLDDVDDDNVDGGGGINPMMADIRQQYHPIFSGPNNISSCDMDITFLGTASCTPGFTRGVSCTALRLNWRRRAAFQDPQVYHNNNKNNQQQQQSGTTTTGTFQGGTWLFDAGECTQLQLQRTPVVKPSKVTKIFLTHAHGDHSFGLPGLMCILGQDRSRTATTPQDNNNNKENHNFNTVIDVYGPEGLRKWLRVAIRYSVSRIVPPYRVHELRDVPMAPEWKYHARLGRYLYKGATGAHHSQNKNINNNTPPPQQQQPSPRPTMPWGRQGLAGEDPNSWITLADGIDLEPSMQYGEVGGGRDIYPIYDHPLSNDGAPVWEVEDEDDVRVYAAPMSHGIPCVGYVVEEATRPGRLRNEVVQPLVRQNLAALKEAGFRIPMKAMEVIKNLPVGSAFTFPDGTVITQEEAVEPPRRGRKVVICGDTANCRALEVLAQDCDVLVHEATNAYLPGLDRGTNLRTVTKDAVIHGHSTPELAGLFSKKVNAKRLLLNHFSARYKGDASVESMSIMMRIEQFAMAASGLNETQVAAAWDFMILPIPSND